MRGRLTETLLLCAALVGGAAAPALAAGSTSRVSLGPKGVPGDRDSYFPAISTDGRYVAFASLATNLVANDSNNEADVFVRDRLRPGTTERVSVGPGGAQSDGASGVFLARNGFAYGKVAMSPDARFVAFASTATTLVPGDTNGVTDVFVRDRQAGTTTRASVGQGGAEANDASFDPAISDDGRYVAFWSSATTLVSGDTNGVADVFVRDMQTGTTTRASVGQGSAEANDASLLPYLSGDGRYLVFETHATNLVPIASANPGTTLIVRDLQAQTYAPLLPGVVGWLGADDDTIARPISGDGRYVALWSYRPDLVHGDTNGDADVFVASRPRPGLITRVNIGKGGVQGNDLSGGAIRGTSISADGRFVAFESYATNLVASDTNGFADVFVRDRLRPGKTTRVSVGNSGVQANADTGYDGVAISADGRAVAFASRATNLVPHDTNGVQDIFVRANF